MVTVNITWVLTKKLQLTPSLCLFSFVNWIDKTNKHKEEVRCNFVKPRQRNEEKWIIHFSSFLYLGFTILATLCKPIIIMQKPQSSYSNCAVFSMEKTERCSEWSLLWRKDKSHSPEGKHLISWINGSVIIETVIHGWSAFIRTVGNYQDLLTDLLIALNTIP